MFYKNKNMVYQYISEYYKHDKKQLINKSYKFNVYMQYQRSGYLRKYIEKVKSICYGSRIYLP